MKLGKGYQKGSVTAKTSATNSDQTTEISEISSKGGLISSALGEEGSSQVVMLSDLSKATEEDDFVLISNNDCLPSPEGKDGWCHIDLPEASLKLQASISSPTTLEDEQLVWCEQHYESPAPTLEVECFNKDNLNLDQYIFEDVVESGTSSLGFVEDDVLRPGGAPDATCEIHWNKDEVEQKAENEDEYPNQVEDDTHEDEDEDEDTDTRNSFQCYFDEACAIKQNRKVNLLSNRQQKRTAAIKIFDPNKALSKVVESRNSASPCPHRNTNTKKRRAPKKVLSM